MHFDKIEDYDFDHGMEFNTQSGEYHSLNPHDLGRPLSHTEMDYNLMYQKQTLNGWRIAGSNADLTLNLNDLGRVLAYHKVEVDSIDDPNNVMYDRHIAAGLFDGQLIWIPVQPGSIAYTTLDPCLGFGVAGVSFTNTLSYEEPVARSTYTVSSSTANVVEGNIVIFTIASNNVASDTTVVWTMEAYNSATTATTEATTLATAATTQAPPTQPGPGLNAMDANRNIGLAPMATKAPIMYSAQQQSRNDNSFTNLDVVGGIVTGVASMVNGTSTITVNIKLDTLEESAELFKFKLATEDGLGNDTGEVFAIVNIINVYNNPTASPTTIDPCVDDITSVIVESICVDDITSVIVESICVDDITSVIVESICVDDITSTIVEEI